MADMKSELIARFNENKENNEQKINKYINQAGKVDEDTNSEIKYTRKVIDQLVPRVNELEHTVTNQFDKAISDAVKDKLEHADLQFIEDMIKTHIDAKVEDKVNEKINSMVEEQFESINNVIETRYKNMMGELQVAHEIKNAKDQQMKDHYDQQVNILHAVISAMGNECTTRCDASFSSLESQTAALSTNLETSISSISKDVHEARSKIKEKFENIFVISEGMFAKKEDLPTIKDEMINETKNALTFNRNHQQGSTSNTSAMLQNRTPIGGASSSPQDMGRHGNGINSEWSQAPLSGLQIV